MSYMAGALQKAGTAWPSRAPRLNRIIGGSVFLILLVFCVVLCVCFFSLHLFVCLCFVFYVNTAIVTPESYNELGQTRESHGWAVLDYINIVVVRELVRLLAKYVVVRADESFNIADFVWQTYFLIVWKQDSRDI